MWLSMACNHNHCRFCVDCGIIITIIIIIIIIIINSISSWSL